MGKSYFAWLSYQKNGHVMQRVTSYLPAGTPSSHPIAQVKLPHDLRHLRR
ncbi:urease accessory protein UreE, partial [Rhizobium johnstonii]